MYGQGLLKIIRRQKSWKKALISVGQLKNMRGGVIIIDINAVFGNIKIQTSFNS